MSTQLICGRGVLSTLNNDPYSGVISALFGRGSQVIACPVPAAGTFQNWHLILTAAPGGTATRTYTLRKNGSNTALTITFGSGDTDKSDTTHTVSFNAGDTIDFIQTVTGTPAAADMKSSIEFVPSVADTHIVGWSGRNMSGTAVEYTIYGVSGTAGGQKRSVCAVAGTITGMYVNASTAPGTPGSGKTFIYALMLNGTLQDGSGGTVDTRVQIVDAATSANAAFSLAVAAGDVLSIQYTEANTPTGSTFDIGGFSFVPTTSGEWLPGFALGDTVSTSAVRYLAPVAATRNWTATEATEQVPAGQTVQYLKGISAILGAAPGLAGSGKSWTFKLRKNGADTALTLTISETATSGSATVNPPIAINPGDVWNLSATPANAPASTSGYQTIGFNGAPAPSSGPTFSVWVSP